MSNQIAHLKRVAVAAHPKMPEALRETEPIAAYLETRGLETLHGSLYDEGLRRKIKAGEFDLLIVLGGDGTMLRAGHLCGPSGVPILGVNMGHFGFLMEIGKNQWRELLPQLLDGSYWLEQRMMLCIEHYRADDRLGGWEVLNEVVVGHGQMPRPVQLTVLVDGRLLTTYVADALIAATATGSTAYALAAGGPILPPNLRAILLVAVAPHLSLDRAIVLSEGTAVSITVHTEHQAAIALDGQVPIGMADGDRVEVTASDHNVSFVRFQDPGYFYRNLTMFTNRNPSTGNHE